MDNLKEYDKFMNEGSPGIFGDSSFGSDLFRISYKPVGDLSNKKSGRSNKKPKNDLLDEYGIGDMVRGKAIEDGEFYVGIVVSIKKDARGENTAIEIESEGGEIVRLAPATTSFVEDRGNKDMSSIVKTDKPAIAFIQQEFTPVTN